jgi:hypothetical protein
MSDPHVQREIDAEPRVGLTVTTVEFLERIV